MKSAWVCMHDIFRLHCRKFPLQTIFFTILLTINQVFFVTSNLYSINSYVGKFYCLRK